MQPFALQIFYVLLLWAGLSNSVFASYGIYVGKHCTADGSVFLAGYGNEPASHWLKMVPRRRYSPGATLLVGATAKARAPGVPIRIPQVAETARYIAMDYSDSYGFVGPLTNGGLNEYGVAGRDIWSPSRDELKRMTPNPQRGPTYSDLSRLVMQRAHTAREAVQIVGALIDKHGYATYGGNSHLFADREEGWVLIEFAGGKGLWVAERLGPDDIRVSRPGYIGDVPLDYQKHPDYMGSPNLVSFAVEQGWYDPKSGQPFNVNKIYGDGKMKYPEVLQVEAWLEARRGKITLKQMMTAVRMREILGRINYDSAGNGQVAHLRKGRHPELGILWVAPAAPTTSPFLPWWMGVTDVPAEMKWHRYLSKHQSQRTMRGVPSLRAYQGQESTQSAFRLCKRLYYLVGEHQEKFLPEVAEALEAFESGLITRQNVVERTAAALYKAGEADLARRSLTSHSRAAALEGLQLVDVLSQSIETRTKLLYGIRRAERK